LDIPPSGYYAISVLYCVYLRLSQGLRKEQAKKKFSLASSGNRNSLSAFMSFLLKDIIPADTPKLPRIAACFRAMTEEAPRLGVQLFIRPAGTNRPSDREFWLRTDHIATILKSLNLKTTTWSSHTEGRFRLEDTSTIPGLPESNQGYFMAGRHLRTVIKDALNTLSVVNYRSHFTVVKIKALPANLDKTFMELETGLLRAINNEGSHWRTDKDLAKEDALEYESLAPGPDIFDLAAHSSPEDF
jgi:hypothetical protein